MIMEGFARRFLGLRGGKNQTELRFTHQESVATAQVEPSGFEMSRAGRRFYLAYNGSAPTGIAPVQAFPTTAAQWSIFNGDPTKSYFFETLGVILLSGTAGVGGVLLACIFQLPSQAGLANSTGLVVASGSKVGPVANSLAVLKASITITNPAVPGWFQVAENPASPAGAVVAGAALVNRIVSGRVGLAPGYGLGLAVLASAGTTPLYLPTAEWVEQETDME